MAAPMEMSELVDSLPNCTDKFELLCQIKTKLTSMQPAALGESGVIRNISFNILFECLNTDNSEQITTCCDVLIQLLDVLEPLDLLQDFHEQLLVGLQHPATTVKQLCLQQVKRLVEKNPEVMVNYFDVLSATVSLLGDGSLNVAKTAGELLVMTGQSPEVAKLIFSNQTQRQLHSVIASGDINRYRVYELCVDLVKQIAGALQLDAASQILQQLTNEVYKDDVLVQLNCLELLTRLATCEHGLKYLHDQGTVVRLGDMMGGAEQDPLMGLLMPGLVKFFGSVAYLHPAEVCDSQPQFLERVFRLMDTGDIPMKCIAVETIGFVGSTAEGKKILDSSYNQITAAIRQLGHLIQDTAELRLKSLTAIKQLLCAPVMSEDPAIHDITEKWFSHLDSSPMDLLMTMAQQPFDETRCHVLHIFRVLAPQPWAQKLFHEHPMFKEYLLDRSTESEKGGKEGKYEIVKALVDSPTAMDIVGRVYFVKLKEYEREGPFYMKAEAAVAMESG